MLISTESLVITVAMVSCITGWLAGQVNQGIGIGILGDILVGAIGAYLGIWLLPQLSIHFGLGLIAAIIDAVLGSLILLTLVRLVCGGWRRAGKGRKARPFATTSSR